MEQAKKSKILLVDDNRHLVVTLSDFLTYEGYDVVCARSGEEALKRLEGFEPDLIILDISMPGMGGIGFLNRISGANNEPRYPVMIFTARSAMEEFFGSINVAAFVAKPCSETDLLREVRAAIASHGTRETAVNSRSGCVLIGEDEDVIMRGLRNCLVNDGFRVEGASTGAAVVELAATCHPSVILLKEILPNMNGRVVAPLIRAMPSTRHVPIILYDDTRTDGDNSRFGRQSRPAGITEYLTTSQADDLIAAVKRAMP